MKYSVLVVDDDSLVNEFLVETLERAGYDCQPAYSGEEALVRQQHTEGALALQVLPFRQQASFRGGTARHPDQGRRVPGEWSQAAMAGARQDGNDHARPAGADRLPRVG